MPNIHAIKAIDPQRKLLAKRRFRAMNDAWDNKPPSQKNADYLKQYYKSLAVKKSGPVRKRTRKLAIKRTAKRRSRRTNPRPLLYIITAKGTGKKMHYDGSKFSERSRVATFSTADAASKKAYELVSKYPVLRKYRIAVESNHSKK